MLSKLSKWSNVFIWAVLLIAVFWAGKGLFRYQFYSTHDLDHHLARSYDAIQTFAEGQFPLRFAGTLNYGCGVPIFNFFYPLLYYLVVLLSPFLKDMFMTFKIVSLASLFVGTIFFYLWAKTETSDKWAALAGSIMYLYAPYRFILVYVRGDPEYIAYAIWPVVLYFFSLAFREINFKKFVWFSFFAALAGGLLTISHNFAAMFLMPILLVYLILKFFFGAKLEKKRVFLIVFSFLSAFGLGAFFIFPALLEEHLTKLSIPTFIYSEHFPELWQVLHSKWGYFYSFPGTKDDGMSFQLGYAHWVVLGLVGLWILWQIVRLILKKKGILNFLKDNVWVVTAFALSIISLFLTLPYSKFVWDRITLLQTIQFPWRLLGIDVLAISTLFVFWLGKLKSKFFLGISLYWFFLIAIPALAFVGTRNDLLAEPVMADTVRFYQHPETNPLRFSWGSVGPDVLPKDMVTYCYFTDKFVSLSSNKTEVSYRVLQKKSTSGSAEFLLDNINQENGKVVIDLSYFPGVFKFELNGQAKNYEDCDGRACFPINNFKQGDNFISWKVVSPPIETVFNWVTVGFFLVWIALIIIYLSGVHKNKKSLLTFIATFAIFGVFMYFRSANLAGRLGFGWDQERDARAAMSILGGHPTLLGPRVQGPQGFFLPPYFFYLISPFYAVWQGSPLATTSFVIFWSVLFFGVAYFVISKLFNKMTALIFLALWAVNPLAIAIDTIAWNPVVIPALVLAYLYAVYKKSPFWIGLILGLGISFHTQFLFMGILLMPLIFDFLKSKKFVGLLYLLIGFVIPFFPILVFDLRHNFLNIKLALGFLGSIEKLNRVLPVWGRYVSFMLGTYPSVIVGITVYLGVSLLLFLRGKIFRGMFLVWTFTLPLFYLFIRNPSEYYFNYLLVIVTLVAAYSIDIKRVWGKILLAVLIVFFAHQSLPLLRDSRLNLQQKMDSVVFIKDVTKKAPAFNISFNVPANEDAGFRYILDFYKIKYNAAPIDPLIEYLIPFDRKPTQYIIGDIGILFPKGWIDSYWLK